MQRVFISSADRTDPSSSAASCDIQLQSQAIQNAKCLSLERFTICNTIYNIHSNNNYIVWRRSAIDYQTSVPEGQYDATTLCTALATAMNNADANNYSLSYNPVTFHITVTGTNNFSLNWATSTANQASKTMYRELGFLKVDTSAATSHTGQTVIDLSQPQYIMVEISTIAPHVITSAEVTSSNRFAFIIPIESTGGELNVWERGETTYNDLTFKTPITLDNFQVRIYDKNRILQDLEGSDWSMIIRADLA
jgi:hypothetical protein